MVSNMNMESAAQPPTSEATVGLTDGEIRDTLEETAFIERSSLLEDKVSYRGSRLLTSIASVSEFYSLPKNSKSRLANWHRRPLNSLT